MGSICILSHLRYSCIMQLLGLQDVGKHLRGGTDIQFLTFPPLICFRWRYFASLIGLRKLSRHHFDHFQRSKHNFLAAPQASQSGKAMPSSLTLSSPSTLFSDDTVEALRRRIWRSLRFKASKHGHFKARIIDFLLIFVAFPYENH